MDTSAQLARHFRQVHFGGNWTSSNLKEQLSDVTLEEAQTPVASLNTILALTYHIHYYVHAVLAVLQGGSLEAKDAYSYDHPVLETEPDWQRFVERVLQEADEFARLLEHLPEATWEQDFVADKYGSYYRNIAGIIEHTHYHLGQISLIKKLIRNQ